MKRTTARLKESDGAIAYLGDRHSYRRRAHASRDRGRPRAWRRHHARAPAIFRDRYDTFRSAVVNEPRGSDVMVGAILLPPVDPGSAAGVIFFNNVGYLGMCGHGTIGVAVALAHLGRIGPGSHRLETPVGLVTIMLEGPNTVAIDNVESYRLAKDVRVTVPGLRTYVGDVAWGGNWFFLVHDHGEILSAANVERLTEVTWRIRQALRAEGITGTERGEIDHIELFGPPSLPGADSKNFVLCPGKAYDRSPCGTGTSAKLACLAPTASFARVRRLAARKHHRQRVRRLGADRRRRHQAPNPRDGLRQCRVDADH